MFLHVDMDAFYASVEEHDNSSQSTRRCAIAAIKRALNWSVDGGYLQSNPLRKLKRPSTRSRETLVTDEQHKKILENSEPEFQDFLTALRETGARPGEVRCVTTTDIDLQNTAWILTEHKTAKTTGRKRLIPLTGQWPRVLRLTNDIS